MVNEESVKRALDARLSALSASPQRRARILNAAQEKEEPIMKKKITAGAALVLAALLMLTGAALAVGSNLFSRFAARDVRYETIQESAVSVTEPPTSVEDDDVGTIRTYVDSAYFDGQSLTLALVLENARSAQEWMPTPEELARMETTESDFPVFTDEAPSADAVRLEEAYREAKAAGQPFGIREDSVWIHDHFYTADGVDLPPYSSDTDVGENGEIYQIREYSPLPAEIAERDVLSVYAEMGRSTIYYYFDGKKDHWSVDVQRENVGQITAEIPRSGAEAVQLSGSGTYGGADVAITARVGAMDLYLTVNADQDVFTRIPHSDDESTWYEQPWMAAVYDEAGREYRVCGSSQIPSENTLELQYDGTGTLPQTLFIELCRYGMDDSEPMLRGEPIELRP